MAKKQNQKAIYQHAITWIGNGNTQAELAKQARISTRAVNDILSDNFAKLAKNEVFDHRKRIGWAETLTRLSLFFKLDPKLVIKDFPAIGWDEKIDAAVERISRDQKHVSSALENSAKQIASLLSDTGSGSPFASPDPAIEDYIRVLADPRTCELMLGVASALLDAKRPVPLNSGWEDIWSKWALRTLDQCRTRLARIANGEILLRSRGETIDFWSNEIMARATNIWTTNIADYTDSYGREASNDRIEVQKAAIKRGAIIVRVFVIQDNRKVHDSLREAINKQIDAGIKVYTISSTKFHSIFEGDTDIYDSLRSSDVMIVDDKFTYITRTDAKGLSATAANFDDDFEVLTAARRFRKLVDDIAEPERPGH